MLNNSVKRVYGPIKNITDLKNLQEEADLFGLTAVGVMSNGSLFIFDQDKGRHLAINEANAELILNLTPDQIKTLKETGGLNHGDEEEVIVEEYTPNLIEDVEDAEDVDLIEEVQDVVEEEVTEEVDEEVETNNYEVISVDYAENVEDVEETNNNSNEVIEVICKHLGNLIEDLKQLIK